MQLHLDLPPRAAAGDLRALWSHLYRLTERLNTTTFADQPAAQIPEPVLPEPEVPKDHAHAEPVYGAGDAVRHGHVKLSDTPDPTLNAAGATAATPKALADLVSRLPGLQYGTGTIGYGPSYARVQITFDKPYAEPPLVLVNQVFDDANLVVRRTDVQTTGFSVGLGGSFTASGTRDFSWLALGTLA